jgi:hypothetical protein
MIHPAITNLICKMLLSGHNVTFMTPIHADMDKCRNLIHTAMLRKSNLVVDAPSYIKYESGGEVRFARLSLYCVSYMKSPVLVLHNAELVTDPDVLVEARENAAPFPGGNSPIIIEC